MIQKYVSKQWFIRMEPFKKGLIDAVRKKQLHIFPEKMENSYFRWIENIRDWCISRQLVWGHQIPVWHSIKNPDTYICSDTNDPPKEVQNDPENWVRDQDVLDTWFSSALWPLSTLGWPEKTSDLHTFYPTSVLITGHDILFFWVSRMILMGKFLMKKVPFKEVFIHGLIYGRSYWREQNGMQIYVDAKEKTAFDQGKKLPKGVYSKWEKMSKSKGNVIDPIKVIAEYGTDAMRIALASSLNSSGQIDLDPRVFAEERNFINKVWNSARFLFASIEDVSLSQGIDPKLCTPEDHWLLYHLEKTTQKTHDFLDAYAFEKAALLLQEFYWKSFCSIYLESVKPHLKTQRPRKTNKQTILLIVFIHLLRLLHPFIPFITEELFQSVKKRFSHLKFATKDPYTKDLLDSLDKEACMIAPYPKAISLKWIDPKAVEKMHLLQEMVYLIRNIRGDMQISPGEKITLHLEIKNPSFILTEEDTIFLSSLIKIEQIQQSIPEKRPFGASCHLSMVEIFVPLPEHLQAKEKNRLKKEEDKLLRLAENLRFKLSNPSFRENAPQKVVQESERTLENTLISIKEIQKKFLELN